MSNSKFFDYDVDKAALIGPAPLAAKFAADVSYAVSKFRSLDRSFSFPNLP